MPEMSFRFEMLESPLTYSPLVGKGEEVLWGEVRGLLGGWNLDEEVGKYKRGLEGGKVEGKTGSEETMSQECVIGG